MDLGLIALAASYKWLLGALAAAAVIVGGLYAAGVFTGGDDPAGSQAVVIIAPTVVPTSPPPTAMPLPTQTPMPTPTPAPTPVPTLAPRATATPEPVMEVAPPAPQTVQVPINLKGAYQVGSLELVLTYEPSVLEVTGVANGDLAGDAIIESLVSTPGKVWIAMISADGVTGDGPMAMVSFRLMKGSTANSPLLLENVSGYNAATLIDLISSSSPGLLVMNDGSYTSPVVAFE
ncbi:MAG: hypothetical protein BZY80_01565 [SAR202 cluster bacterium Io17-Chloro-G2]|nr:MAG: hypothetical protein BZY80_01565 [SAR202 cluster bacterium Io17-Chloro-G2]